jgi:small subunit ribosomal protein S6
MTAKIVILILKKFWSLKSNDYFCTLIINKQKYFIMNHYETVFILNPVLSETQIEETVSKFENFLTSRGAKMISKENWGLKKLAYEIQNKKSGFYHLFEFQVSGEVIAEFETEFKRDERVMRYLTVALDKHAVAWAERRREKLKSKSN